MTMFNAKITFFFLAAFCSGLVYSHRNSCSFQKGNFIDDLVNSCPGLTDSNDKSYCCYDFEREKFECCDIVEYTLRNGIGIVLPVVVTIAVIVAIIVACVSCLCCRCCPWYRRRNPGVVYGIERAQAVRVVPAQPNVQAQPYVSAPNQNTFIPYPVNPSGMPVAPPPYCNEAYTQQSPYNPHYRS
ncbi:protein shisa-5-like isoform X2 [Prorops nasuta]|uniref:protein shisa-5-like isoform X2 n=1 Tax=Prorops nasuta TaxID=863751 RepID=UPI0034CDA027